MTQRSAGFIYLVAFALCIPIANWMIGHVGTTCVPDGPCLIPVWPGITAPSGVLMIGLALVLRDLVQRTLGLRYAMGAILIGALLSAAVAPPALVLASATAFLLSELADLLVYTPLQKKGLVRAVFASSVVGLIIDSAIFLYLAFGSIQFIEGQVLGKAWMVLLSLPIIHWLRRQERPASAR
ncbi:MAG: VUT family protein [Burkholderiaceae bacterium]